MIKRMLLKQKSQLAKIIVTKAGTPDKLGIDIYWLLYSFYKMKCIKIDGKTTYKPKLSTKGIFTDYTYLCKKFNVHRDTIKSKFAKLEELGLLHRSYHHRHYVTNSSYNKLIIYVWRNNPLFDSQYGIYSKDVTLCPPTTHERLNKDYETVFGKYAPSDVAIKDKIVFDINIDKKTEIINTEGEDYPKKAHIKLQKNNPITKVIRFKKSMFNKMNFKKDLAKMYPISDKDCEQLQKTSGRNFTINAMNEILLSMSKRVTTIFRSKRSFMLYMQKVFIHEKRETDKTAYEGFRIFSNRTPGEITVLMQEKYLSKIEYSHVINSKCHFKKKLASALNRTSAYEVLQAYRDIKIEEETFKLYLSKHVNLTELQRKVILNLAQATDLSISNLTIIMPKKQEVRYSNSRTEKRNEFPNSVWGKIRQAFDPGIDFSWISKLEANIDTSNKTIDLKAPSRMYSDWIRDNYLKAIISTSRQLGFEINYD